VNELLELADTDRPARALERLARMDPRSERQRRPPQPVPWILAAVVVFNLSYLRGHLRAIDDLNDGSFHAAYVRFATDRVLHGRSPFDGLFTELGLGFPILHHYQVLPHVLAGALGALTGPGLVYRLSLYLLLALWPVAVYVASRLLGLSRAAAVGAAAMAPFVISLPGYGYQQGSYTWGGYGMWSQLWGMWLFAFGIALAWRAIDQRRSLTLAALVAAATITSHALTGYLLLVVIAAFALVATPRLRVRMLRAVVVVVGALAGSAWLLIPAFRDKAWSRNGLPKDTFWVDSYGARKVLGWLVSGELFDRGRLPVITLLAGVGVVVALRRVRIDPPMRAVLALTTVSMVLFFGRPTLGPIVDLLPARDDLFLPRMIVGVHLGGVLLAGIGLAAAGRAAWRRAARSDLAIPGPVLTAAAVGLVALLLAPAWTQLRRVDLDDAQWMAEQRRAERTDGRDFEHLVRESQHLGGGRVYAGLLTNWGASYRIGYVPAVIELLNLDADAVGFTGRVPAITEPAEGRFDDSNPSNYELFAVRWVIAPDTQLPPPGGVLTDRAGRHRLYQMPGTGLLQVVDTTAPIATDRQGIDAAIGAFLRSSMAAEAAYPVLDLAGASPAHPTAGPGTEFGTTPGHVDVTYDIGGDGVVGGEVTTTRPAAVVLKMSYHPRWRATVDGAPAPLVPVAPGYLAVDVPAGRHVVEFRYHAVSGRETLAWFGLAVVVLGALHLVDRRLTRRGAPVDQGVVVALDDG
jgi:hypothetical protein